MKPVLRTLLPVSPRPRPARSVPRARIQKLLWALTTALAMAIATGACGSSSTTSTGPSPAKCQVSLEVSPASFGPGGGSGTLSVSAPPECAWTVSGGATWLSGLSPTSGQGNGQVTFDVAANPSPQSRQGELVVNENRLALGQEGASCAYTIAPSGRSDGPTGGSSSIEVAASAGCTWTASSAVPWITITSGATGSGNGAVGISVAANTGPERTGTLTIAGQTFTLRQAAVGCVYTVAPTGQSIGNAGGAGTPVSVNTTSVCAWTAVSGVPWITITSGAAGSGNGQVQFSVAANTGIERSGTVSIGGQTVTVTQAAAPCAYTIAPATQSIGAAGGSGTPVTVSATGGSCAWTAVSEAPWLTVTAGASGRGGGTVTFTIAANPGPARTGVLRIATQAFTVAQASGCAYTIAPTSQSVGAAGGAGTPVTVTTAGGCTWTAASTAPWISVTSGTSGTGNGTVGFTVAANPAAARTGTLTIAGQTFTVSQAAGCGYAITPTAQAASAAGGPVAIGVTAAAGCTWTAVSNAPWISISSAPTGTGNGNVSAVVAANSGTARTGTLTIAGQTFTVTQAAAPMTCAYTINPTSRQIGLLGGTGTVAVTSTAGCTWTATKGADNPAWITITSGASGSGSGSVSYAVAPLLAGSRTGTLVIAGRTFTVTQTGLIP